MNLKEEHIGREEIVFTRALFVAYKLPFEDDVGVIRSGNEGEEYMLTEWRLRVFVVGETHDGRLVTVPFQPRRNEFDYLPMVDTEDLSQIESELASHYEFAGRLKGPYKKSTIGLVDIGDLHQQVGSEDVRQVMKWWQILMTPETVGADRVHKEQIRQKLGIAINGLYEESLVRRQTQSDGGFDHDIPW